MFLYTTLIYLEIEWWNTLLNNPENGNFNYRSYFLLNRILQLSTIQSPWISFHIFHPKHLNILSLYSNMSKIVYSCGLGRSRTYMGIHTSIFRWSALYLFSITTNAKVATSRFCQFPDSFSQTVLSTISALARFY